MGIAPRLRCVLPGKTIPLFYCYIPSPPKKTAQTVRRSVALSILDVDASSARTAKMMSGDISGAFRLISVHADHIGGFAGSIPGFGILVINSSCLFGWMNSPSEYWVAGSAINRTYPTSSPLWPRNQATASVSFDGEVWCDDDRNCTEPEGYTAR